MIKRIVVPVPHRMSEDSIDAFLTYEEEHGASGDCLRQRRNYVCGLYRWLPEGKEVTAELLRSWRCALEESGYSHTTVDNYVKGVNRYLDFSGRSDLRFSKGRAKDLTGMEFGYLTALEKTGEKHRRDYLWLCRCRCGREVQLPATRLLTGNTLSCGCLMAAHLQKANRYIDHTSLRACLEEKVKSTHAASGYTGVAAKRGKWQAYITYKGRRYSLGCYDKIEDAVKARAYGKELVRENAQKLLADYEALHRNDPALPINQKSSKER